MLLCGPPLINSLCYYDVCCLVVMRHAAADAFIISLTMHFLRKGKKTHFSFELHFSFLPYFFLNKQQIQNLFICVLFGGQKKKKVLHGLFFIRFTKKRASRDSVKCQKHDVIYMYCSVITSAIVRPRSNEKKTDGWPTGRPPPLPIGRCVTLPHDLPCVPVGNSMKRAR